jgi:hypothetical protein
VLYSIPMSSFLTYHSNYTWRRIQVMKLLIHKYNLRKYSITVGVFNIGDLYYRSLNNYRPNILLAPHAALLQVRGH